MQQWGSSSRRHRRRQGVQKTGSQWRWRNGSCCSGSGSCQRSSWCSLSLPWGGPVGWQAGPGSAKFGAVQLPRRGCNAGNKTRLAGGRPTVLQPGEEDRERERKRKGKRKRGLRGERGRGSTRRWIGGGRAAEWRNGWTAGRLDGGGEAGRST